MQVRRSLKLHLILLITLVGAPVIGDTEISSSQAEEQEWVYYGFSPAANYTPIDVQWGSAGTILHLESNGTELTVVGYNDSTQVRVYDITGNQGNILKSFSVDRMKSHTMLMPLDTFFKVVSEKPVAALLHGGISYALSASRGFYPSTDGGFAGKEFIFHAVTMRVGAGGPYEGHSAYGVEQSQVTLYDHDGKAVRTFSVRANSTVSLPITKEDVYRITSTGRIMVYTPGGGFDLCPSTLGGKAGRLFYSFSPRLLIIAQERSARVELIEAEEGTEIAEKDLSPGEAWFVNRTIAAITITPTSDSPKHVLIRSTEDVVVYSATTSLPTGERYVDGMGWISNGISFLGVKPNQPVTVFVVSRAIVFSPEADAQVDVSGIRVTVEKGGYKDLGASGTVTLTSNSTLIVQVVSQVATRNVGTPANPFLVSIVDLTSFASYLISPQAVSVTYPPPKPAEEEGGRDYTLIIGVAAVAVAVAAAGILMIRKRGRG